MSEDYQPLLQAAIALQRNLDTSDITILASSPGATVEDVREAAVRLAWHTQSQSSSASQFDDGESVQEDGIGSIDNHEQPAADTDSTQEPPDNLQLPKEKFSEPSDDPFERLLIPMLEGDAARCNKWKEELQKLIVFSGLVSGVVSNFLTYVVISQTPDGDAPQTMVSLLANIAFKLDDPTFNLTAAVNSILPTPDTTDSTFDQTDSMVNYFWYLSLAMSLTVALYGTVALQWLREHERYDPTLDPKSKMATLNARLHGLQQWKVPEFLSFLPFLLVLSLLFFFIGMLMYMWATLAQLSVMIYVAIFTPLLFIAATALLPVIQVCVLQDAFRLSINNNIPAPCPFKSPQSIIFWRLAIGCEPIFRALTFVVACVYAFLIKLRSLAWKRQAPNIPIFRSGRQHLKLRLRDEYPAKIGEIRNAKSDWASIDKAWLDVRTIYAASLKMAYRDDKDLEARRTNVLDVCLPSEVYDCSQALQITAVQGQGDEDNNALYRCIDTLCDQAVLQLVEERAKHAFHVSDLLFALTCILFPRSASRVDPPITPEFIKEVLLHPPADSSNKQTCELLRAAIMACWALLNFYYPLENLIHGRGVEASTRLVTSRLEISPERLFTMTSEGTWAPRLPVWVACSSSKGEYSKATTRLFFTFLEQCATMQRSSQLDIHRAKKEYGGLSVYTRAVAWYQTHDTIEDTFSHLEELCASASEDLVQDRPFLALAACFYLDAVIAKMDKNPQFAGLWAVQCQTLANVIVQACQLQERELSYAGGWPALDDAIKAICGRHNPQPTLNPGNHLSDRPYSGSSSSSHRHSASAV